MTEHQCHAIGCSTPVQPKMHMCLKHWRMVPKLVQNLIWKHYRPGQEIDKQPSLDYIVTAFVSISCVALKEGQPLPTMIARTSRPNLDAQPEFNNKESALRGDQESA